MAAWASIRATITAMNPKPTSSTLDPEDDAPELTDEELDKLFDKGVWKIAGCVVSREEGMVAMREALTNPELPHH